MVMQPTADYLVGGSNPGRVNMAAAPPTTVDRPGFQLPTYNPAVSCGTIQRRCDSNVPPHCLEPSE